MSPNRALMIAAAVLTTASEGTAQPELDPPQIELGPDSAVCAAGVETNEACISLPPAIDLFLLVDDTGSLVPADPQAGAQLVEAIQGAFPAVDWGFGVGRFEDYGGALGCEFATSAGGPCDASNRPFILNQPIATSEAAGGDVALRTLIADALARTAPGGGSDEPEAAISEALFQAATGAGFSGDAGGTTDGIGDAQTLLADATQDAPDESGDVPAFDLAALPPGTVASGSVGGAGFRPSALKLILIITDQCSVTAFPYEEGVVDTIPATVTGAGAPELVSDLACAPEDFGDPIPGLLRHGFVSDAKSLAGNSVPDAVAPAGAATVQQTIDALAANQIFVLGAGPMAMPVDSGSGPSEPGFPAPWLSAMARITLAVDAGGDALVFQTGDNAELFAQAVAMAADAAEAHLPLPTVDVALVPLASPMGLSPAVVPDVIPGVEPGGAPACFTVGFEGVGSPNGRFELEYQDARTGTGLALLPGEVQCTAPPEQGDLLLSFSCFAKVEATHLRVNNEDILAYDEASDSYRIFFDGSDVGLDRENVDAFDQLPDGRLILSLSGSARLPGLGWVRDEDVLLFTPDAGGPGLQTSGAFALFLDGSDAGIQGSNSDIDALAFPGDGFLYYSLQSTTWVGGELVRNEDIVRYDPGSGVHALWFDGSSVGLSQANVDGFEIQADGSLLLSFSSTAVVPGVPGLVEDDDVVSFHPGDGAFALFFRSDGPGGGGLWGFGLDVDGTARETVGGGQ